MRPVRAQRGARLQALPVTDASRNERTLVLAAQRGEREAFSELVRAHERRAYAVARAIVVNHEDAEDWRSWLR